MGEQIQHDLNGTTCNDQVMTLMNTYLTEWCHRDELLWKQVFKYFYANLIVLFLPFLTQKLGVELPQIPSVIFAAVALVMSVVFLIVSLGYAKRLAAISESFQRVAKLIPSELGWVSIRNCKFSWNRDWKKFKWFNELLNKRMSIFLCCLMFISLLILSIVMIFVY